MKKRAIFLIVLIIIFGVGISFFMYFPKSIENALNRIKYPFEVGEILASQQIDEISPLLYIRTKKKKAIFKTPLYESEASFTMSLKQTVPCISKNQSNLNRVNLEPKY